MRSPKLWCVLLALFCIAPGPLAFAQSAKPSDDPTQSKSTPKVATEDEVQQLRREVAELKAQIQRLVEASAVAQGGPARLVQTNAVASSNPDVSAPVATPAAPRPLARTQTSQRPRPHPRTSTLYKKRSTFFRPRPTTFPRQPRAGTASTFS